MDGQSHFLSLKVMRVSRPALSASSWQPFYSSNPAFSAHSTDSTMSLQGNKPLPGHPKTLRDLTHASNLLSLPASFGSIVLGETFASCLCVNNETNIDIEAVSMRVEMQTATTKVVLAEYGGPDFILQANDTLENVVHHEIKELGQHVLACMVLYRLPPSARHAPGPADDPKDERLQTFRKFYKFSVTNPLSVKTKVHTPRAPSALMNATAREKIFLEIHIQNLTQEPMWFERMCLEPSDGWQVDHGNMTESDTDDDLFSGTMALMQPQDMRQYVYTLSPVVVPAFHTPPMPGITIPLGRLDISWRSSFGEPGRLLTSMLSRRIPAPAVTHAPSAIPPYLQRGTPQPFGGPQRPGSPQRAASRPEPPPIATKHGIHPSITSTSRPGSPSIATPVSTRPFLPTLDIDLVVRHIPQESIWIEKPFVVQMALTVSASAPRPVIGESKRKERFLSLAIQHIRNIPARPLTPEVLASEQFTLKLPSALSSMSALSSATASPTGTPARGNFNYQQSPSISESSTKTMKLLEDRFRESEDGGAVRHRGVVLPLPTVESTDQSFLARVKGVEPLGSSIIYLDPIRISHGEKPTDDNHRSVREFQLTYLPVKHGLSGVSGLRVILIDDELIDEGDENPQFYDGRREAAILREWDFIGEVYVKS